MNERLFRWGRDIGKKRKIFFFSSRRRHTRLTCDWSSDVCSSDLCLSTDPTCSSFVSEGLGYISFDFNSFKWYSAGACAPQGPSSGTLATVGQAPKSSCTLKDGLAGDRKSTRLNSSHMSISYAVFC